MKPQTSSQVWSSKEWQVSNLQQCRTAEESQRQAELTVGEATHVGQQTTEITEQGRQQANRKLDQRIGDLKFKQSELQIEKQESMQELDYLITYKKRIEEALDACSGPLAITRKCSLQRGCRIGVELVHDEVARFLQREEQVIQQSQRDLRQILALTLEQARFLRATQFSLDKDIGGKESALDIDSHCIHLSQTSPGLSMGITVSSERSRNIREWEFHTKQNISASRCEIKNSRQLRSKINLLLTQLHENISSAYENTNRAFNIRIQETKDIKAKLELELAESTHQGQVVRCTLTELEEPIGITQQHLALAVTRLSKRALRTGIEQCRDEVECHLEKEVQQLKANAENLQMQQEKAESSLCHLRQAVEKLTEDLNKKINTLMIDEVECMTQRLSMNFHLY